MEYRWEEHSDNKDGKTEMYFLRKKQYSLNEQKGVVSSEDNLFGWIEKKTWGDYKGKYEAGIPIFYDSETDSDSECLGFFNTLEEAKEIILSKNHPDWGLGI